MHCPKLRLEGPITIGSIVESSEREEDVNRDFETLKETKDVLQFLLEGDTVLRGEAGRGSGASAGTSSYPWVCLPISRLRLRREGISLELGVGFLERGMRKRKREGSKAKLEDYVQPVIVAMYVSA